MAEELPKLNESSIRKLASDGSFERGMDYYYNGAIIEPIRQGMELRAYCTGSRDEPYRVRVKLTKGGIGEVSCNCPRGGTCKHIVALLLTYIHRPQSFHVVQPLEEMLAQHSKEELVALIGDILKRYPDSISLVELSTDRRRGKPIDVEAYRRQVQRALHRGPDDIEWELRALEETAGKLAKSSDWLAAGALYCALLTETVSSYEDDLQVIDEEGDIAILVEEFAKGLGKCLERGKPSGETRREWLGALLNAELTDIELGGIDLAPAARDIVLKHATDEEWEPIERRVREQIQRSSDWERETLVEFLVERRKRKRRGGEGDALIRELGTPEQQAFLLVKERKIDEAMRIIPSIVAEHPGLLLDFADALVKARAKDTAVGLVEERARGARGSSDYTEWLAKYYRRRGDLNTSLEWEVKTFLRRPSIEGFKTLREVSSKAGGWDGVRSDVLKALERERQTGCLIEIALHEGDVARALELLPRLKAQGWEWRDYEWRDYKRMVARAAEKGYPREAMALYKEMVERTIEERRRGDYQQAASDLERIKELHEHLNASSDWDAYIQNLRTRCARLPAFQEELRRARL